MRRRRKRREQILADVSESLNMFKVYSMIPIDVPVHVSNLLSLILSQSHGRRISSHVLMLFVCVLAFTK